MLEPADSEELKTYGLTKMLEDDLFTENIPIHDQIVEFIHTPPKLKERNSIVNQVIEKIKGFVKI